MNVYKYQCLMCVMWHGLLFQQLVCEIPMLNVRHVAWITVSAIAMFGAGNKMIDPHVTLAMPLIVF